MAQFTRAELLQQVIDNFPDNSNRLITEEVMRTMLNNLIDSGALQIDEEELFNLRTLEDRNYKLGEAMIYDDGTQVGIYQANQDVAGLPFNSGAWDLITLPSNNFVDIESGDYTPVVSDAGKSFFNSGTSIRNLFLDFTLVKPFDLVTLQGRINVVVPLGMTLYLPNGTTITDDLFNLQDTKAYVLYRRGGSGFDFELKELGGTGGGGGAVDSVNGQTGVVVLDKTDIGLDQVDNTSDANKPISTATQTALNAKVTSVVAGSNIEVNNADPANPIVSAFPTTTAGVLSRTYFTGDTETLTAGTFYKSNRDGKGTVASVTQTVTVNDNQKDYFAQDLISDPYPIDTTIYAGAYSGVLNGLVNSGSGQQMFTVEIYKTDLDGTPVASGIAGQPVGDLGVQVVAIAESGLIDLPQGQESQFSITAELTDNLSLLTTNRVRYHVSAEKVGTAGGAVDISISYGTDHIAHLDVPVQATTDTVINLTSITGATVGDALEFLNTNNVQSASNGLNILSNDVKIGGALTEETTISSNVFEHDLIFDFSTGALVEFNTEQGGQVLFNIDQSNGIVINNTVGTGVTLNSASYTQAKSAQSITNNWDDGVGNTGLDFRSSTSKQTQVNDGVNLSTFVQNSDVFRFQGAKIEIDTITQNNANTSILSVNTSTNEIESVDKSSLNTLPVSTDFSVTSSSNDRVTYNLGGDFAVNVIDNNGLSDYDQVGQIFASSNFVNYGMILGNNGSFLGENAVYVSPTVVEIRNYLGNGLSYQNASAYSNISFTDPAYVDHIAPIQTVKDYVDSTASNSTKVIKYEFVKSGSVTSQVTLDPHSSFASGAPIQLPSNITSAKIIGFNALSTTSLATQASTATFEVRTQINTNHTQRPFGGGVLRYTNTDLTVGSAQGTRYYESIKDTTLLASPVTIDINDLVFIDLNPSFWQLSDLNVHLFIEVEF